jgi:GDP-L-fucose synthase
MVAAKTVLVTGATGFLGRHVTELLARRDFRVFPVSRALGYDLTAPQAAFRAMLAVRPDVVVHLAARVGGIGANMTAPADFFRDNMQIGMNIIQASSDGGARLVMVGTVCSYPKDCPLPFKEEDFWNGYPEPTNAPYGIAKKALLVMMEAYRKQYGLKGCYLVPANLFGPGDNFDPRSSHVIPALIRKFVEAKEAGVRQVDCWGTGKATRSFLYVADAAEAILRAVERELDHEGLVNLPGGPSVSIEELASIIAGLVGYEGAIFWDRSKPDGQPLRAIDGQKAQKLLEWKPTMPFADGLKKAVDWYLEFRSGRYAKEKAPAP